MNTVSLGFRAKTAKAIAIALSGVKSAPAFVARWSVLLYDPGVPATGQPHHEVMELPWAEARAAVQPLERRIETVAIEMLDGLLREMESQQCRVGGIGVVGSPDRNLDRIGNSHIRAHAAEGILFRHVIEVAAHHHKIPLRSFSDRSFEATAPFLASIGRSAGKPWRADERAAAMAAWHMLPN